MMDSAKRESCVERRLTGRPRFALRSAAACALASLLLISAACATQRSSTLNRLAVEKSPYLLQHAANPIDWYPWGEEAFRKAREENKPVFLSIGYSTCHWCQVMERESFSDPAVGALLDEHFVSIKVDREERPDVDAVYMAAARLLAPEPGWPLNLLLTPEGHAFYAASYIPRDDRPGAIGMRTLLPRIAETWKERRADVAATAETIAQALRESVRPPEADIGASTLGDGIQRLSARFDQRNAGFLPAPKFPSPNEIRFLLRWWKRSGDARALAMAEQTLSAVRDGGIYDQIGFGVHRYATDQEWRTPHFEKMLYDQALLVVAAIEAFQATGKPEYRRTADETIEAMIRDFRSPEGGFHSALSAEAGAREGAFYQWKREELDETLGAEAPLAAAAWGVETIASTPFRDRTPDDLARELSVPAEEIELRLERARVKLLAERMRRPAPDVDRKILADWNGLAIAALATAGAALEEPSYVGYARQAADFVLRRMRASDGLLLHRSIGGVAGIPGYLDDYAFLIQGLLSLYEASGEIRYLEEAVALEKETARLFRGEDGSYYLTAGADTLLIDRPRDLLDDELPSGASVHFLNLLRLWHMTGDPAQQQRADGLLRSLSGQASVDPGRAAHLLLALDFGLGPAMEIVLAGVYDAPDTLALRRAVFAPFAPSKVVLHRPPGERPAISAIAPFTAMQRPAGESALAYVCVNQTCEMPTGEPAVVWRMMARDGIAD